jgi:hypothetical protein
VWEKLSPGAKVGEPHFPSGVQLDPLVEVCGRSPTFVHVRVSPTLMVMACGLKTESLISTVNVAEYDVTLSTLRQTTATKRVSVNFLIPSSFSWCKTHLIRMSEVFPRVVAHDDTPLMSVIPRDQ